MLIRAYRTTRRVHPVTFELVSPGDHHPNAHLRPPRVPDVGFSPSQQMLVQLQQKIESLPTIEQAKGMIMAVRRCTADEAFAILVTASNRQNVKLREVAQRIVDRGA